MDVRSYNREAWNREVEAGKNQWTIPVTPEVIAAARQGVWQIVLTPTKPVPRDWFPDLEGLDVLCLASGGGQQGPVLAAAGAKVTVLDNSPRQLAQDQMVAAREGLDIRTLEGDMRDLSAFADARFDLIVHPVSNIFVPDILPVWREAHRVLRPGGVMIAGITNPVLYVFDPDAMEQGNLQVRYSLPYSDLTSPTEQDRQRMREQGWALEFSHTLEEQIGGQMQAGFLLAGFYEDIDPSKVMSKYMPVFFATRAVKPTV